MKDEIWSLVALHLENLQLRREAFYRATDGLMIAPESPLCNPFYDSERSVIGLLEILTADVLNSISWFVYENDFGKNELEAGYTNGKQMRKVKNADDLRRLLEADCKEQK